MVMPMTGMKHLDLVPTDHAQTRPSLDQSQSDCGAWALRQSMQQHDEVAATSLWDLTLTAQCFAVRQRDVQRWISIAAC